MRKDSLTLSCELAAKAAKAKRAPSPQPNNSPPDILDTPYPVVYCSISQHHKNPPSFTCFKTALLFASFTGEERCAPLRRALAIDRLPYHATPRLTPRCHPRKMWPSPKALLRRLWRIRYAFAHVSQNRIILKLFLQTFGMKNVSQYLISLRLHSFQETIFSPSPLLYETTDMEPTSRKKAPPPKSKSNN